MPKFKKNGFLFNCSGERPWTKSYAANPVALPLDDRNCRFYFSSRDQENRAHISFVDMQLFPNVKILSLSKEPCISPGNLGLFDDSGTSLACIVNNTANSEEKKIETPKPASDSEILMYYLGWNLGVTVPWRNSIGLARKEKHSERFEKVSLAPILDRNSVDPYSISYPFVLKESDGWKMWYGSNLRWGKEQKDMDHVLKYATSTDGQIWKPTGDISIGIQNSSEYAFSRPSVIKRDGHYHMWYSYRGSFYRIGYAISKDGIHFERKDDFSGISISAESTESWDSESICYPHVFEMNKKFYMVYNGNHYGKTGFGWAELISW